MCQSFFKKILHEWRIYTQVVSRILYLDMYLSGMIVAYHLKHEPPSTTFSANIFQFEKKVVLGPTHLHYRGFSTCVCYHPQLWALTSLFSPLPRTTFSTNLFQFDEKGGAGRYSLCGTFPSRQVGRQPLAVRLYEDCSSIVSGLSSVDCSTAHICLGFCIMRDFPIFAKHPAQYHKFSRLVPLYQYVSYRLHALLLVCEAAHLHGSYHDYLVRRFAWGLLLR